MKQQNTSLSFSILLRAELEKRKSRNTRYSMRAMARDLKVTPSKMSEILNGKRRVGPQLFEKITLGLGLSPEEMAHYHRVFKAESRHYEVFGGFGRPLLEDEYALVAEPIHFTILSLLETKDFQSDEAWIARRLGVTLECAQESVARLLKLGLVVRDADGKLAPGQNGVTTTHEMPSEVLRKSHRNVINQSLESLERDKVEDRDFSSITITMNPAKMKEAKELLREFRRRFCRLMEGEEKNEVYTLNLQFFPNTVREARHV